MGSPAESSDLHTDTEDATSLVCEVDLPADLVNEEMLARAVDRSMNLVAAYFEEIQSTARA